MVDVMVDVVKLCNGVGAMVVAMGSWGVGAFSCEMSNVSLLLILHCGCTLFWLY